MLDIAPQRINRRGKEKGIELDHPSVRIGLFKVSYDATLKANPAPLFSKKFASARQTRQLTDDMARIKNYDWTIEVVVEPRHQEKSL